MILDDEGSEISMKSLIVVILEGSGEAMTPVQFIWLKHIDLSIQVSHTMDV
jgi:hypothetical protein